MLYLLYTYADHKVQLTAYEEEINFEIDKLETNVEYMFHRGCCETAEHWIRCLGMSPDSPFVEKIIKERS